MCALPQKKKPVSLAKISVENQILVSVKYKCKTKNSVRNQEV